MGTKVGVAWYRPEQWARLLEISVDREDFDGTYEQWENGASQRLRELRAQGLSAEKLVVDVEELGGWCRSRGLSVDGRSRSNFVAEKLRQKHQPS